MNVLPFSADNLALALSNRHTDPDAIKDKRHFEYFLNYLGNSGIGAATLVIEDKYISKDFLHDYASYYAFCFEGYDKFCRRIHFFSHQFSKQQLQAALLNPNEADFWTSYLGFIVVKPIPVTIVGYTVLKTYLNGEDPHLRKFWGLRDYKVHFFGKVLRVSSLAFQEQDSVLAACATTAIWSMLNKASIDFHTILKVPSEITKDADKLSNDGSRLFPNKGLDILQICQAINNSGLAPEVWPGTYEINDENGIHIVVPNIELKKRLNAYQEIGVPIILGIKVPNAVRREGEDPYGHHAIAVSGHKTCSQDNELYYADSWAANRIERIYVHDDQYGPFARVTFLDDLSIQTDWSKHSEANLPSYVVSMIIPVYPKIRISYVDIEVITIALNGILIRAFRELEEPLFWDIKVMYSESFKEQIIMSSLEEIEKITLLEKSMPKYLWVVTCCLGNSKLIEFTFDATDVRNSMLGNDIICYFDPEVKEYLHDYIQTYRDDLKELFDNSGAKYIDYMLEYI